jgi:hypothetical protein
MKKGETSDLRAIIRELHFLVVILTRFEHKIAAKIFAFNSISLPRVNKAAAAESLEDTR